MDPLRPWNQEAEKTWKMRGGCMCVGGQRVGSGPSIGWEVGPER